MVGFDSATALDTCWKEFTADKLGPVFTRMFITPAVLKKVGAKKIQLRTRLYQDEYDKCKTEIMSNKVEHLPVEKQGKYSIHAEG